MHEITQHLKKHIVLMRKLIISFILLIISLESHAAQARSATQAEVNAGVLTKPYVSPLTLANWSSATNTISTLSNLVNYANTNKSYFILGRSSTGDGGEGIFFWDAASTSITNLGTVFKKPGVTTGRWKRYMTDDRYRVDWFGAVGDNSTDNAVPVQNAIDTLIGFTSDYKGGKVVFTRGKKYIIGTMMLIQTTNSGGVYQFVKGIDIIGDGGLLVDGTRCAQIIFTNVNLAGFAVQFGRDINFENLAIKGPNNMPNLGSAATYFTNANFFTTGVRTNRFSPNAGIVTDPFSANTANGDMTDSANQYPGFSSYYRGTTGSGSAKIHCRNCMFQYWICGIMWNPDSGNQQGDGCIVEKCVFNYNTYGIAVGQNQSRGCSVRDCDSAYHMVFINCATFGQQRGASPVVMGGQHNSAKYLMEVYTDFGTVNWSKVYCESIFSIGNVGLRNVKQNLAASFEGCHFSFYDTAPLEMDYHGTFGPTTIFTGCYFTIPSYGVIHFLNLSANSVASIVTFNGCQFRADLHPNLIFDRWERVLMNGSGIYDTDTQEIGQLSDKVRWWNPTLFKRMLVLPGAQVMTPTNAWYCYDLMPEFAIHDTSTIFDDNGGATVVMNTEYTNLLQVGDLLSTGATLRDATDSGNITVTHQFLGKVASINLNTAILDHVTKTFTGSLSNDQLKLRYIPRWHPETTGDVLLNSVLVSNVTVITGWMVGDRIRGTGITDGTFITATNGDVITLSHQASATTAATRLYDADVR